MCEFERGAALQYLTPKLREALVSHRLLRIISCQAAESVTIEAIDDLAAGVRAALLNVSKNPRLFEE